MGEVADAVEDKCAAYHAQNNHRKGNPLEAANTTRPHYAFLDILVDWLVVASPIASTRHLISLN